MKTPLYTRPARRRRQHAIILFIEIVFGAALLTAVMGAIIGLLLAL